MPIYEFGCPECGKKVELILSMAGSGSLQSCPECQASMDRLIGLPLPPIVPTTGKDQILRNLNAEDDGHGNYRHHKEAMWKGLNQRPAVTGRGFG